MDFIHLHNHTDYSVLDGAITVDKLIKKAVELKMPAIAVTDHGNMYGAVDFYMKAQKAGITPIVGQEFYMAPGSRFNKEFTRDSDVEKSYHLILLAKNNKGYKNLMKLSSIGFIDGFYYKPRIDFEVLEKHSEGIICSSACIAGEIPRAILKGKPAEARQLAGKMYEIFGKDHFYLEMQDHGLKEQKIVNKELIKMSKELNIPLIATNDAHYLNKEDSYSHEVLLCIQTGRTMNDTKRMRFSSNEFYIKSAEEMFSLFSDVPDALYNTYKIYEMMDLEIELGNPILPNFEVPEGYNLDTYLKHLVYEGAKKLYSSPLSDEVVKRIEYELGVITSMQFSGYFLIVWDFIEHAREVHIPVGPGRGSAAGSIVSYCLNITALDPLKYDLLFERFLNPDRNEMPDMDIDFCANRREDVIDYVKEKYGNDHVSQIITYNKMKAKAVVKDVARALDIPFARANEISKFIEEDTLSKALNTSKELKEVYNSEVYGKELIDISLTLEGLVRSAGKHAAGVVISRGPLTDYVPLYKDQKEGSISSQYEKGALEEAGLVKMDFLGLKNLTIIDSCIKLIKKHNNVDIDIEKLPLDDQKTFALLQRADTKGVFQLESGGMQNIIRRLGPTTFEDIIAIVALYRPGPLGSGMVDDFIKRKRNPELVKYQHESLEPILKDTLGVVVYQEQVMLISQIIAGFTLPEADKLRKAMGKKKIDIINELEEKFLDGAENKKIDRELAENLYNMIKKFGEYGFNKSHSAAYALVTYQTAYLKAHYPIAYMTALLSAAPDKQDDVIQYINDCKAANIKVLPPTINNSTLNFSIEKKNIRFGLGAIKGVGSKAIESIVKARTKIGAFTSLYEFLEHIDLLVVNKGVLESLAKAGAFDCIHKNRAELFNSVELIIDTAKKLQADKASGQGNLFMGASNESGAEEKISVDLNKTKDWHDNERLAYEKEVLGLYVSGHPLAKHEEDIKRFSSLSIASLNESHGNDDISLIGIVSNLQIRRAQKSGHRYAFGLFEDMEGTIDIMFFSRTLNKYEDLIMTSEPLMITGSLEMDGNIPKKLLANEVKPLRDVRRESISAVHIKLDPIGVDENILVNLKGVVEHHKGSCPIYFHVNEKEGEKIIKAHASFNIKPSEQLVKDLSQLIGSNAIGYSIGH